MLKKMADAQAAAIRSIGRIRRVLRRQAGSKSRSYFDGKGPVRSSCIGCGGCMVGCRFNAKNTLDKNYLYFAEQRGAKIFAETRVVESGRATAATAATATRSRREPPPRGCFKQRKTVTAPPCRVSPRRRSARWI